MSRPTRTSPASSPASATLRLAPEASALLALWWGALHLAALGGVVLLDVPWPLAAAGAAALVAHASVRRPRRPPTLLLHADGWWSAPGRGPLRLHPATAYGRRWVKLVLVGARPGDRLVALLLSDQLPPEAWRALQAELRRRSAMRDERFPDFS